MQSDPSAYIIFAALLGAAIGFFGASLMASRTIRRHERTRWQEGYDACNRDHCHHRSPL